MFYREGPPVDPDVQLQMGIAHFFDQHKLQHRSECKDGEKFEIDPYLIDKAYRTFAAGSKDNDKAKKMIDDYVTDYRREQAGEKKQEQDEEENAKEELTNV